MQYPKLSLTCSSIVSLPISTVEFGMDTSNACLRTRNVLNVGESFVTTTISATRLDLNRVPHAYGPTMLVSTTTGRLLVSPVKEGAVGVVVVVVGVVSVFVVVMISGDWFCWLFSLYSPSLAVTASTRCRKAMMSEVEGVRASSFELSMLSSSGLVGVLVRVGVNWDRGWFVGMW